MMTVVRCARGGGSAKSTCRTAATALSIDTVACQAGRATAGTASDREAAGARSDELVAAENPRRLSTQSGGQSGIRSAAEPRDSVQHKVLSPSSAMCPPLPTHRTACGRAPSSSAQRTTANARRWRRRRLMQRVYGTRNPRSTATLRPGINGPVHHDSDTDERDARSEEVEAVRRVRVDQPTHRSESAMKTPP